MLGELDVRNLGIIEHIHLSLDVGFGVLTGETGAGKSLLVQSLQLLAGVRAEADQVRSGCDRLQVEGRFAPPQAAAARALLAELGVDADGELVVRREVAASGRSRAWVNDVAVTAGSLQRLAPHLLSIDGQHEQRGLTDPGTHLAVIDEAGGLEDLRSEVGQAFAAWDQVTSRLGLQRQSLASRRDRLDVISFQAREIEEARLQGGEDQLLREERNLLRHAGRIAELAGGALQTLGGEAGATSLARAARELGVWAIAAIVVRKLIDRLKVGYAIDDDTLTRISGFSVDFMVAGALAAISLVFVGQYWLPILVMSTICGLMVTITVPWMSSRMFNDFRFERMLMLYGVSTGTLSTGLALLRVMDPEFKTKVSSDYMLSAGLTFIFAIPFILCINLPAKAYVTGDMSYFWIMMGVAAAYLAYVLVSYIALAKKRSFAKFGQLWYKE